MLSGLLGLAAIAGVPTGAAAQQNDFNHWGYVCAELEGARTIAVGMRNEHQMCDWVWNGVSAVRAAGHDCRHTRGPMRATVVRYVEAVEGSESPLHILDVRVSRAESDVYVITVLE